MEQTFRHPQPAWPPPFNFRRSCRARRIILRVTPELGLEIVLPEQANEEMGRAALEKHKDWVLRHLKAMRARLDEAERLGFGWNNAGPKQLVPGQLVQDQIAQNQTGRAMPSAIGLHGGTVLLELCWSRLRDAESSPGQCALLARRGNQLYSWPASDAPGMPKGMCTESRPAVQPSVPPPSPADGSAPGAPPGEPPAALALKLRCTLWEGGPTGTDGPKHAEKQRTRLRGWLREYARSYLGARLHALASIHGVAYSKMRVGIQKTRWGSYSSRGVISLNAKLIFLPTELSDNVLLHELCHVFNMSHGKEFWAKMRELEPRAREYDALLNRAYFWVPPWFH